ncbi:hypothetical protein FHR32_008489 [Streptosporangium album]|uniref:Luciferase-like domain-containing protein n=1 Tax=Streptosporangium album TaxID=47479 RepID=A0A7W7WEF6_9ACTN|nr:hypothetical protein [Streptosporangium album]
MAEHHNMPAVASSATAVPVGQVAAVTSRVHIGSGGIMLPNHPPLVVVAEQFGTLATLHPGRIDLGVGRAPGTDPWTARALRRAPSAASDFPDQRAPIPTPPGRGRRIGIGESPREDRGKQASGRRPLRDRGVDLPPGGREVHAIGRPASRT